MALGLMIALSVVAFALCVLTVVSTWKVFVKNNKPGWAALIPIYREIVIWQMTDLPVSYIVIGLLLPFANIFFMMSIYMYFAQKQNRTRAFGLGLFLLPFVFMPILAFSNDNKKSVSKPRTVLCGILLLLLTILIIVAIVPWDSYFTKFTAFKDFNTWLSKIDAFKMFLGSPAMVDSATQQTTGVIPALGAWGLNEVSILLLVLSLFIMAFSETKLEDFISNVAEGVKKVLPVGLITIVVSLVLVVLVTSGVGITLVNGITSLVTSKFNIVTTTIGSVIGSVTTSDFYYYISTLYIPFKAAASSETYYGVVALIVQAMFYLTMIITPTSVGLLIGLSCMDISYGKWLKYIWKLLLIVFFVVILTATVLYLILNKYLAVAVIVGIVSLVIVSAVMIAIAKNNK